MDWLLMLGLLAVVLPSLYIYTVSVVQTRFPTLRNRRICILIAHPDDEAMFFAPTVMALTRPETGNHVKILCLSSGDADGLGETRKEELVKSALTLGLRGPEDIFVVESADFRDSMMAIWDAGKIAEMLSSAFQPHLATAAAGKKSDDNRPPTATIDVLITFDAGGVSGHPNHISLYRGARLFVTSLARPGWKQPVDMYSLSSVPLLRKYTSFIDVAATLASWAMRAQFKNKDHPVGLVFLNSVAGPRGILTAWKAMTTAHKSQMVWFRYGWIWFSRYMVMNDLRLEKTRAT